MKSWKAPVLTLLLLSGVMLPLTVAAQMGKLFEPERKVVKDPLTGYELIFLTSQPRGDSKIYPTHPQWS